MAGNSQAQLAATALAGGTGPRPVEEGPEAAALYAVAEQIDGNAGTRNFSTSLDSGNIAVGQVSIPGKNNLTSKWNPSSAGSNTGTWDGLQRRAAAG